jgi:hypothetical protein
MASTFPTAIDNFTDPLSGSALNSPSHSAQHADLNDAAEKIETYMGLVKVSSGSTDGSTSSMGVQSVFTSLYENYFLQLGCRRLAGTSDIPLNFNFYSGATLKNGIGEYAYVSEQRYLTTQANSGTNSEALIPLGRFSNYQSTFNITINSPQNVLYASQVHSQNMNVQNGFTCDGNRAMGIRRALEVNDGFFVYSSAGTVYTWTLYGYRK